MGEVAVVVIGAGHSGLAMSRCLADRSVEHVVLERGRPAHSWRTQRWDSLRLLTPNWMTRLPGFAYTGEDPDGYLSAAGVVQLLEEYATASAAPVQPHTTVTSVRPDGRGFAVETDRGRWRARAVVLAAGAAVRAPVPAVAYSLPREVHSVTTLDYRHPGQLPDGGVLVVGASASGIQLAEEIHLSGRPVTVAVGEHVRMPRRYRDRDILWWMDAAGVLRERYDEIPDLVRARHLPSMQLAGSASGATVDLNSLGALGVRLVGRLAGVRDGRAQFSGSLPNVCALADLKLHRLLDGLDLWAAANGLPGGPGDRPAPTRVPDAPPLSLSLTDGTIRTVLWATGLGPDHSWLEVPVLDRKGRIRHDGGVAAWPGLYLLGAPFLRRRNSTLIDGAAADARDLAEHLVGHLRGGRGRPAALSPV